MRFILKYVFHNSTSDQGPTDQKMRQKPSSAFSPRNSPVRWSSACLQSTQLNVRVKKKKKTLYPRNDTSWASKTKDMPLNQSFWKAQNGWPSTPMTVQNLCTVRPKRKRDENLCLHWQQREHGWQAAVSTTHPSPGPERDKRAPSAQVVLWTVFSLRL